MTTLQHVRDQHDHVEMLCKSQEWDMTPDQLDRAFLLSLIDELEAQVANYESDAYVLSLLTKIDELEAIEAK